ncbi:hypothetical protein PVAP13_7KG110755 [Panicum virgatum]|uniref:Uncharacterized protein n=1 Tax=Panicum virgatum TaxID=38727 RepID=A0A8T0QC92_PANVG|nr:hypothetical protein PVAP13_7KG110755 [Panicum virgatum]
MPPETGGGRKESQQSHAPTLPQPSITGIRLQSAREGREAWWVELTPNHKWKRSAAPWGVQPEPWTDGSIKYYSIIQRQQPNRPQIEVGRGGPKRKKKLGIDGRLLTRGGFRGEAVAINSGSQLRRGEKKAAAEGWPAMACSSGRSSGGADRARAPAMRRRWCESCVREMLEERERVRESR